MRVLAHPLNLPCCPTTAVSGKTDDALRWSHARVHLASRRKMVGQFDVAAAQSGAVRSRWLRDASLRKDGGRSIRLSGTLAA